METAEQSFAHALARMERSPAQKLFNPGLHKFLVRYSERLRGCGAIKDARLFFGQNMKVVLPEVISEVLYTYGFFDETVTWMVLKTVKEKDVVLDIGAHFGYFSLLFSHLVGSQGKVFSFEPTPSTFCMLKGNTGPIANIVAMNLAAGSQSGECTINDFGLKYSAWNTLADDSRMPGVLNRQNSTKVNVEIVRLDQYLAENHVQPTVIKIDTENFEYQVITGLTETLVKFRPTIIMETGSENALRSGLLLLSLGYKAWASNGPGSLFPWEQSLELANVRYKDMVFSYSV